MDGLEGTNLTSSLSTSNLSTVVQNEAEVRSKTYAFLPLSYSTRVSLLVLLVSVGIIALVGNALILCFSRAKKKSTSLLKNWAFQKNFEAYISSLAVSDALCAVISIPFTCVQFHIDLFQNDWGCRIVRYVNILFPAVTINNLFVISIGKYFATRKNPRIFRYSTVKRLLCFAWFSACFYVLVPVSTFKGIRYDLNDTHYTVICTSPHDKLSLPFKIVFTTFLALQYMIPCIVVFLISTYLIFTVRSRVHGIIDVQRDNAIKSMRRAAGRRATIICITIMLAFVIPHLFYVTQAIYKIRSKVDISFEADFILRYGSVILVYSNSAINVIIYLVQMKDFRGYLKRKISSMFAPSSAVINVTEIQMQCRLQ